MKDHIARTTALDHRIRGVACEATDLVRIACARHSTSITASVALGRALIGGALLAALSKDDDERYGLRFDGGGPLGRIVVEADPNGAVRGKISNPEIEVPPKNGRVDVATGIGIDGFLTVIRDHGLKQPFTGTVALQTGAIAEDLAYYLSHSEQVPSAVGIGVTVNESGRIESAGGFLIQALPPPDESLAEQISKRLETLPPIASFLQNGQRPAQLLDQIFAGLEPELLEEREVFWRCLCARDKMAGALLALGRDELSDLILDEGRAEVVCDYCLRAQEFSRKELSEILARATGA